MADTNLTTHVQIHDHHIARLIREAEYRAERDACSCVIRVDREGDAQAKRRRFLAELQREA